MTKKRRWGLLLRMSDDGPLGIARQEKDLRGMVRADGGTVAKVYVENDTSAFRRRKILLPDGSTALRVVRPEFRSALADLAGGEVIDALGVYDIDRLARDPRDLEDLIDVVEQNHRLVKAVTGSIDLSTDHGIAMSRVQVAIANKSSRDTSRRLKRKELELVEQGLPTHGGRRLYGYRPDRVTVVEEEAAVIREAARRLVEGDSLLAVVKDLNARGVAPAHAAQWSLTGLRSVVSKPHVAGLRTHHGQPAGEGTWPAILDRDTHAAVLAVLDTHARPARPPVRKYLLSWIAKCGLCGGNLGAAIGSGTAGKVHRYRCQTLTCRRISRAMTVLDEYVISAVLARLADLDLTPPARAAVDDPAAARLVAAERRRGQLLAAFADVDGDDPVVLRAALRDLDGQIAELRSRTVVDTRAVRLSKMAGISRQEWDALPMDRRRAAVADLYRITVHRGRRGRGFDASSVELVRL